MNITNNTPEQVIELEKNKKLDRIITMILAGVVAYIAIRISTLEMFLLLRDSGGLVQIADTLIKFPFYVGAVLTGGFLGFAQGIIDPILAILFYGYIFTLLARTLRRWTNNTILIHLIQFVFVVFLVFIFFPIIHGDFSQTSKGIDTKEKLLLSKLEKCLTGESENSKLFGNDTCFSSEIGLLKESRSDFKAESLVPICSSLSEESTLEVAGKSFPGYEPLSFREYCFFALYEKFQPTLTFWLIENTKSYAKPKTPEEIIREYNVTLGESLVFSSEANSPAWGNIELAKKLLQKKICEVAGKNSAKTNAIERCLGYMSGGIDVPYTSKYQSRNSDALALIRQGAEEIVVQENKDCVSTLINYTASAIQRGCIREHLGTLRIYFASESVLSGALGDKWKYGSAQLEKEPGTTTPSFIQFTYQVEGTKVGSTTPISIIQIAESPGGKIDIDSYIRITQNGVYLSSNVDPEYKADSRYTYQREIFRENIDKIILFVDRVKRSDGKILDPQIIFRLGNTDIAINGGYAEEIEQNELHKYMLAFARSLIKSE